MSLTKAVFSSRHGHTSRLVPFDNIISENEYSTALQVDSQDDKELTTVAEEDIDLIGQKVSKIIKDRVFSQPIKPKFDPEEYKITVYNLLREARKTDPNWRRESEEVVRYLKFFYSIQKALQEEDYDRVYRIINYFRPGYVIKEYLRDYVNSVDKSHNNLARLYLNYDLPNDFYMIASEFFMESKIFLEILQQRVIQTVIRETMRWSVKISRSRRSRVASKARALVEPSKRLNGLFSKMVEGLIMINLYTIDAELFNIDTLDQIEWGDGKLCYHKVPPENKNSIMKTLISNLATIQKTLEEDHKCVDKLLNNELLISPSNEQFIFFSELVSDQMQEEQEIASWKLKSKM